jgi:phosphoribosyl 1,2-cyclic phosphate phosphodiesterase
MSTKYQLTFLGTGTSTGVPALGCTCSTCTSTNPRNHRFRSSVLLTVPEGRILIDTPPELRLALLREQVPYVHAILLTHYHVDHLYGMDDVRLFPKHLGGPLFVYCSEETEAVVRRVFSYAFSEDADYMPRGYIPQIKFFRVEPGKPFEVLGETITPIALEHGRFNVLGFRLSNMAYCTDVSKIPETSQERLQGLDLLVLDALRRRYHPNHLCLEDSLAVIRQLRPQQAYLTHISHELEYQEVTAELPERVRLSYDGLKLSF